MTVRRRICARTPLEGKRRPSSYRGQRAECPRLLRSARNDSLKSIVIARSAATKQSRAFGNLQPVLVLDDLPERVLMDDLVALEAVDVAALVVQLLAVAAL